MKGTLITCDHRTFRLPPLLSWDIVRTGGVPCDSFSVTCLYDAAMSGPLHLASGFLAEDANGTVLRGFVDEYEVRLDETGRTVTLTGRGLAGRLLDNEARPATYQRATLAEILKNHAAPYGVHWDRAAALTASAPYTVEAGVSQWTAVADFCRTFGGFTPRFTKNGVLIPSAVRDPVRRRITDAAGVLALTRRENHYGVLSEVLVIDKTRGAAYPVKNPDFLARGGQCRHVVYTPGKSTWRAMRYTGAYQIARSAADELEMEVTLPGSPAADPGDLAEVNLPELGVRGEYRIAAVERTLADGGEVTVLTLKKRRN
jgi:prophage tail gpP-like protein